MEGEKQKPPNLLKIKAETESHSKDNGQIRICLFAIFHFYVNV